MGQITLIYPDLMAQFSHFHSVSSHFIPHSVRFNLGLLLSALERDVFSVQLVLQCYYLVALFLDLLYVFLLSNPLLEDISLI